MQSRVYKSAINLLLLTKRNQKSIKIQYIFLEMLKIYWIRTGPGIAKEYNLSILSDKFDIIANAGLIVLIRFDYSKLKTFL